MFGLMLTTDTRYQKIFMIVGPKRSGKGTIGRVLTAMLGKSNVANPTMASMTGEFGLWPLIDKQLAIISDARVGKRADPSVVAEQTEESRLDGSAETRHFVKQQRSTVDDPDSSGGPAIPARS